ncbi:MAG: hypothetical protein R3F47_08020 [Gammaproteobacteria bacterium]
MTEPAMITCEACDLDLFSADEDLFGSECERNLNTCSIDQTITNSAHRALQVCNAQAQLLLAQYQSDTINDMQAARAKAEAIAHQLGEFDYAPEQVRQNPFDEAPLRAAWEAGYQKARESRPDRSLNRLHTKFWEQGIDTEDTRSQFELCALELYRLAAQLDHPEQAGRAKRLAMEMCRYHEGLSPTPKRQAEIDRFMAQQAERLLNALEF